MTRQITIIADTGMIYTYQLDLHPDLSRITRREREFDRNRSYRNFSYPITIFTGTPSQMRQKFELLRRQAKNQHRNLAGRKG